MRGAANELDGIDRTAKALLYDPMLAVEGMAQSAKDTYQNKGLAYCVGYVGGNVVMSIMLTRGVSKLGSVGKVGTKLDDVGDVGKIVNRADDVFIGKLKGEDVKLKGVKTEQIKYVKRGNEELSILRREFNNSTRKDFLKDLSKETSKLKNAGMSNTDILKLQNGRVPDGWQVHHKLPLDDSGTNTFDNLVLIKNDPYHKVITNYQNSISQGFGGGSINDVKWPIVKGNIVNGKYFSIISGN